MRRQEIEEFHYITPIANLPSLLARGILSHNEAQRVPHQSISMDSVQDIRRGKRLPDGTLLHDYANVYFQARNPMLYRRLELQDRLAVLRVDPSVLDIPGAVVTDGNAAAGFTAFQPAPHGIAIVDRDTTFAARWTHQDPWEYRRRKASSCAELLVPGFVPPNQILGAWVASAQGLRLLQARIAGLPAARNRRLFFAP
jgi:hypothetical protein